MKFPLVGRMQSALEEIFKLMNQPSIDYNPDYDWVHPDKVLIKMVASLDHFQI